MRKINNKGPFLRYFAQIKKFMNWKLKFYNNLAEFDQSTLDHLATDLFLSKILESQPKYFVSINEYNIFIPTPTFFMTPFPFWMVPFWMVPFWVSNLMKAREINSSFSVGFYLYPSIIPSNCNITVQCPCDL